MQHYKIMVRIDFEVRLSKDIVSKLCHVFLIITHEQLDHYWPKLFLVPSIYFMKKRPGSANLSGQKVKDTVTLNRNWFQIVSHEMHEWLKYRFGFNLRYWSKVTVNRLQLIDVYFLLITEPLFLNLMVAVYCNKALLWVYTSSRYSSDSSSLCSVYYFSFFCYTIWLV